MSLALVIYLMKMNHGFTKTVVTVIVVSVFSMYDEYIEKCMIDGFNCTTSGN